MTDIHTLAPVSAGIGIMTVSGFLLLVLHIRRYWSTLNNFILHGRPFVQLLTGLSVLPLAFCFRVFLPPAGSPPTGITVIIGCAVLITVYGALTIGLLAETRLILNTLVKPSRLCLRSTFLFLGFTALYLARLRGVGGSAGILILLPCLGAAAAAVTAGLGIAAGRRELNQPPPSKTAAASGSWRASWITVPGSRINRPNTWLAFRGTFTLEEIPAQSPTRIGADSKYWLWINGESAVFEGGLKRGPDPHNTYYDTVDLARWLKQGENTIAVLVWYFGRSGFSHNDSGRAGLIVDGPHIRSGAPWKAAVHRAFGSTGAPRPNYRLSESNIRFDARKDLPGWTAPGYDDSGWQNALEAGRPPASPWNNLTERPIPLWRDSGLKEFESLERTPGNTVEGVLPYNAQITPWFRIQAPPGLRIDIRTDNYKGGGENSLRAEYITREGIQEYESPGWMNGHRVIYSFPAGVDVLEVKYRETGYDTEFSGSFRCEDEFFNTLWDKSRRSLYVNMRDTYMDCPDRERAQWWGDIVLMLHQAAYAFDSSAQQLTKKGILELVNWQDRDSALFSPVPGSWKGELPHQMLMSAGPGFLLYWLDTGDRETIRRAYPAAARYYRLWETGRDGLIIDRKGGWQWYDWGDSQDKAVLTNGWYCLGLGCLIDLAGAAGFEKDIPEWEGRRAGIEGAFNRTFWTGREYRSPAHRGSTDDRANALAVLCGLAEPEKFEALRDLFRREKHASPGMEKIVLEALYRMGYPDDALDRCRERFKKMVESGRTTLWEGWELDSAVYGGGSSNHAWGGHALILLARYAAGIRPLKPGFSECAVLPQPGRLGKIDITVPTVRGSIKAVLRRETESFRIRLETPVPALVGLPAEYNPVRHIRINGMADLPSGTEDLGLEKGFYRFRVPPGNWEFLAEF